jgi:hypothetical protein
LDDYITFIGKVILFCDYIVPGKQFLFFRGVKKFDSMVLLIMFLVSAIGRFECMLEIFSEANLRFGFSGISYKESINCIVASMLNVYGRGGGLIG